MRQDFTYDHEGDVYLCPGGKMLTCKGTLVNDGATLRKVPRSIYEGARDMARDMPVSNSSAF